MKPGSRILISGAGIAGLTAAIRLARAGLRPVVVEKTGSVRAGGYLVALSHQAYRYAGDMGLLADLRPHDLSIASSSYHDRSGRTLLELDYRRLFEGLDIIQLMRSDLAAVLFAHADDLADIRFGDQIARIDDTGPAARVTFESGRSEEFDLVIGADGVHSRVRELVFDPQTYTRHYLDLHCAAYHLPNVLGIDRRFATHMERERYMAAFTTGDDEIGAVFVWASRDRTLPPQPRRRSHLLRAFAGTTAATARVLDHCPSDRPFYMDVLSQVDLPAWSRGRCVLVGDAAHCLTLFSGRGAAAAFAGACRLTDALTAHDRPADGIRAYEAAMRPIVEDIMPATRAAVKWYVPMTRRNHAIRNGLMWAVPNLAFRTYFRRKYSKV